MKTEQQGLTLIELLVTLGVLSILMSVALPGFRDFTVRNNTIAQIRDLETDLRFARSEAAKVGAWTRVCVGNSSGCRPGWGTDWAQGWVVLVNGTSTVLRLHAPLETGGNLTAIDNVTSITSVDFNRYGFAMPVVFRLCDGRGKARAVLLSRTGNAQLAVDTDSPANGLVDDMSGNDITCD